MNNSVKHGDEIVGFRCWTCGGIFQSMWGEKCNKCREEERRHYELIQAIKEKNSNK